ncbi:acyl-CoA dehydrogenase family protein [Streptomyces sp. UG1]|uniref:acyl-CoA dehydrogenase family protein n=1 Tax=Streptomyces sp. UG1 TaxID=3417652 RepID=UPI003CF4A0B9
MVQDTTERALLRDAAQSVLKRIEPSAEVRRMESGGLGYSESSWQSFLTDLGAGATLVPEEHGGLGLGFGDACVVLEELGAVCYNGPFLSSAVLSVLTLTVADTDVAEDLSALAAGERTAAVTALHHGPDPARWPAEVRADGDGPRWALTGRGTGVLHGLGADVLYVVARHADGLGVWAVDGEAPGHRRRGLVTLDLTRAQSEHVFERTPARLVLTPSEDTGRLRRLGMLATVALSAEQVGACEHLLATTLEYARTRYQFGRAIGSFQAIKHRCVDMAIAVQGAIAAYTSARDQVDNAGGVAAPDTPALRRAAAIAGSYCSEAFLAVAGASLQIHGGIGMAWEHDTHLYLRRAKAAERLFGSPVEQRRELLKTLDG